MTIYPTPKTDQMLAAFRLITKEGIVFNDSITPGQKQIMECILTRSSPDSSGKRRIHIMAHTRYGKSLAVGAATGLRASIMHEDWVIVAGTKEQAQIIMDHVITFITNSPILRVLLTQNPDDLIKNRKRRNFITFRGGGSVRAYTTGPDGDLVMGQGCPNVILDEASLVSDIANGKVERMLGDNAKDNFFVKIGNPFHNNHFKDAFLDENYYHINIDYHIGLAEGRLTEAFIEEMRKKPHFAELYENIFPDDSAADADGYKPLFTHGLLERALVEVGTMEPWGLPILGADPADGGDCESVIVKRWPNLARVIFNSTEPNSVTFSSEIAPRADDVPDVFIDKNGVGSGTVNTLAMQGGIKHKVSPVNVGDAVPDTIAGAEQYMNLRAYVFWQVHLWLEAGGKLERHERFKQLLHVKYRTSERGKIQIISKEILRKRGVNDLGAADALALTFAPPKKRVRAKQPTGGVDTFASMRR